LQNAEFEDEVFPTDAVGALEGVEVIFIERLTVDFDTR
jgi:hypothetical protein